MARSAAFTLIELLVCIGIISLLLGLGIPVMSAVRARARDSRCLANLSHMGRTIHTFANTNDDAPAPTVRDQDFFWNKGRRVGWDIETGSLLNALGGPESIWQCPAGLTAYVGNARSLGLDNRNWRTDGLLHRVRRTQWHSTSQLVLCYDFQTNFLEPFPHAGEAYAGDVSDEHWGAWPRGDDSTEVVLSKYQFGPHATRYGALFADAHAEVRRYRDRSALLWSGPKWWSDIVGRRSGTKRGVD